MLRDEKTPLRALCEQTVELLIRGDPALTKSEFVRLVLARSGGAALLASATDEAWTTLTLARAEGSKKKKGAESSVAEVVVNRRMGYQGPKALMQALEKFAGVCRISTHAGWGGSGFAVGRRHILTNAHLLVEEDVEATDELMSRWAQEGMTVEFTHMEAGNKQFEEEAVSTGTMRVAAWCKPPQKNEVPEERTLDYVVLELEAELPEWVQPIRVREEAEATRLFYVLQHPGGREVTSSWSMGDRRMMGKTTPWSVAYTANTDHSEDVAPLHIAERKIRRMKKLKCLQPSLASASSRSHS